MDMDVFGIDDLLDFSNDHLFSSSTSSSSSTTNIAATDSDHHHHHHHHFSYLELDNPTTTTPATNKYYPTTATTTNFADYLCVPSDDIAELEWLSNFVDESFTETPAYSVTGTMNVRSDTSSKTKRSRSTKTNNDRNNKEDSTTTAVITRRERSASMEMSPRKCTHCSSEKTPQWRTGPLGPKTLCNACGVRYKSGRLVPEYRPAASPTFVLTQHSNSHRKVMELRRQKEVYRQQQQQLQQEQQEMYGNQHRPFQVC